MLFQISCTIHDPYHSHGQDSEASVSFRYTFLSDGVTRFSIHGINGNVDVTGSADADSVEVWGERIVRSDDQQDAEDHLELLTVEVNQADSGIDVQTHQPNQSEGKTYEVVYHVRLPKGLQVSAELINGTVTVDKIANRVSVSSTNGNVVCSDIEGDCEVALVNGLIDCGVALPTNGRCSLSTVNGNVSLVIPDTTSAGLDAKVTNGSVSVSGLQLKNMRSSRTSVSGTLGDGTGTIQLSSVNGNVQVEGTR
jgi:DUF4097 and DUF4098 domain-containing protein YvlB